MEMQDQANPQYCLHTIYFYLTRGCNLRCRHCWIAPAFQTDERTHPWLGTDLFRSILDQAATLGLASVKLTGGEPLIHPRLVDLLNEIQSRDLRLIVETNGVACTYDLARRMKACRSAYVSVSLDGACAETHDWVRGVTGAFHRAVEGIGNLVSVGFRPQIIMSLMRRNKDELESVVELAERWSAGSVKLNIVQPTARGAGLHGSNETLTISELVALGQWVERDLARRSKVRIIYDHPLAFRPLGRMFGQDGDGCSCCAILGILGVLADGSYALCGIGESVQEMVFGNAATHRLQDVWQNNPVLNEIREGIPGRFKGICGSCLMKARCLGSCLAQNFYSQKDFWAPFWYCEQAWREGLFPQSRLQGLL